MKISSEWTLVFVIFISLAVAQSTYTLLPNGSTAPSGRVDGTIAYDLASRQIYLFGGTKHSGERTNDAVPNPLPKMSVGLMQINVRVPRGAETGQRHVVLKMGDRQSQILVYM